MAKADLTRRSFVAGASAMALAFAGTALASQAVAEEAPADAGAGEPAADGEGGAPEGAGGEGGAPEGEGGGAGGPGGGGSTKDIEAAKAAAKAEGRTFGYAGPGDWLGEPEDVEVAQEIDDFDVVVIGAGHAGIQAALAAAEKGAKVAICEKNAIAMILGEDFAAWNAKFVQDAGFPEYNLGEVITEFNTRSGGRSSQEVVASYVNNSGETLDHMIECMKEVATDSDARAAYDQVLETTGFSDEYTAGADYEQDLDESFYTYDVTRSGKIIIQAQVDAEKVHELTDDIDWASLAVDPNCEQTEEGYQQGYQALYDACASFYDNNNQAIDHVNYPIVAGTKTWATTVQFMGHFHGREGHGGVASSSIIGNVQLACLAKAVQAGAQVFMGYKGYEIVKDDEGKVSGVICYDSDGEQYVKFNCRAVVSCAGGFVQNSDMCWALLNSAMESYERSGGLKEDFNGGGMAASCDGSGIKMLCWAGGFVEAGARGDMHLGGGPSTAWGANCHLWLDENGERFCNEGNITGAGTACGRKTGKVYCVLGGDYLKHISSCGLEHTGPNFGRPEYIMDLMYDMETGAVDSQISVTGLTTAERMGSGMYKASSLESLGELLGVPDVDKFVAGVNAYNELCYKVQDGTYSCDPQFGKGAEAMIPIEGPVYYGTAGSLGDSGSTPNMVTLAGIVTDKSLNVLDADSAPIPGLYAAGNDLGGRYGTGYATPAAGNSIGMAGTNGRVAGQNAAAYLGL